MSLVYITHHNENVIDYEKVGYVETPIKKMKYTSMHKKRVMKQINQPYKTLSSDGYLLITDAGKHERRTMGCAKTQLEPPKCFLRKNEGLKWKRLHDHKCPKRFDLPPIPKVSELPPRKICKPKEKTPKSELPTGEVPQEALLIVIETPRDAKPSQPTKSSTSTCGAKKQSPICDPCEYLSKQKEQPTISPCGATMVTTKTEQCETLREKQRTPKTNPCKTLFERKNMPIINVCDTLASKKVTPKCTQTHRTKGGLEDTTPNETSRGQVDTAENVQSVRSQLSLKNENETFRVQTARSRGGLDQKPAEKRTKQWNDPCKRPNFVARHIRRMKNARAIHPPPRYIDTPVGDTHNLINSGLLPQFICGRNFAKVPCYINVHKKMLKKYKEDCAKESFTAKDCEEFVKKQGVRKMTIEERLALLEGLKANYMEKLKVFQTFSLYTDTPTKKLRKGRLEKELDQLEMDIKFIEDNTDIYVSDF